MHFPDRRGTNTSVRKRFRWRNQRIIKLIEGKEAILNLVGISKSCSWWKPLTIIIWNCKKDKRAFIFISFDPQTEARRAYKISII